MSPTDDTRDEELLARYRRAGDADASGPSDAARAAILAESRRVAETLAKQAPRHTFDASGPAANDSRWKITAFGTVGAALLAALLIVPRYWETAPPAQVSTAPTAAPAPASESESASAHKLQQGKPNLSESDLARARQSYAEPESPREAISPKTHGASAANFDAPASAAASAPVPPSVARNYAPGSQSAPTARAALPDLPAQAAKSDALSRNSSALAGATALKPATLQSAATQGDVAQAAALLDQGAVIDARDDAGRTPLMLAVTQGRVEMVRLLLARGSDPNAADNAGHTPLQQAVKRNLNEVAALLEQAGAH